MATMDNRDTMDCIPKKDLREHLSFRAKLGHVTHEVTAEGLHSRYVFDIISYGMSQANEDGTGNGAESSKADGTIVITIQIPYSEKLFEINRDYDFSDVVKVYRQSWNL